MSIHAFSDHNPTHQENQSHVKKPIVWFNERGCVEMLPEALGLFSSGGGSFQNIKNAEAPRPTSPTQSNENEYEFNRNKTHADGERIHKALAELKETTGENGYGATKKVAKQLCFKSTSEAERCLRIYRKAIKEQKNEDERQAIIKGVRQGLTNKQIGERIGVHEKNIAEKRREIQSQLWENAE